jgi:putative ABC transport system ATP-binding protein
MDIFQKLNDKGITILLVTHEPDIAEFSRRQIIFKDGRVKTDKTNTTRKSAAEVLKDLPAIDEDDEE